MNEPPIVRPVLQPTHDLLQQLADEQRTTNQILQSIDITLGKLTHTNNQLLPTIANDTTSGTRSIEARASIAVRREMILATVAVE